MLGALQFPSYRPEKKFVYNRVVRNIPATNKNR